MMLFTKKQIIGLAHKVVEEHAYSILAELDIEDDGVLSKIVINDEVTDSYGRFNHTAQHSGFLGSETVYVEGSGNITLYPVNLLYLVLGLKKDGSLRRIRLPFVDKERVEELLVNTLAHELRHYWQYKTGVGYEEQISFMGIEISLPYEMRWIEKDANAWGLTYIKSLRK